ncbi:MAG: NUDIX hydrolase [Acidiferrobacterales bacterium]|nr:NUDIX hydrolase [Acidiferrobacterales bacterium]
MNIQAWHPDVTVAAICERDGEFLLVEETSKTSKQIVFNQPAGHLDEGETILQAVVRETREETCRHFTPKALIGLYRLELDSGKTYIRYTFCGSVSEVDKSLTLDPDIIRTHWQNLDQIRANKSLRSPLVLGCIEDYLAGTRYPLEILKELS